MPRLPIISSLVVAAACITMIALGIWQLQRSDEKREMLARYQSALSQDMQVAWPISAQEVEESLYRRSSLPCRSVISSRSTAGRSQSGGAGWAHVVLCALDGGGQAELSLGWSREAIAPEWTAANVSGFIAPSGSEFGNGARLVASEALAGLAPLARPDPSDLPNNHIAYAGQWFFFALTALVIYILALRGKAKGAGRKKGGG